MRLRGMVWLLAVCLSVNAGSMNSCAANDPLVVSNGNSKTVQPGVGHNGKVLFGTRLTFRINFENLGSDTSRSLLILDTLDQNLDLTSLQVAQTTHPVQVTLGGEGGRVLRFEFQRINLLWAQGHGNKAQGFVEYSIEPRTNLPEGTQIRNRAHIHFEQGTLHTNTTLSTYESVIDSGVVSAVLPIAFATKQLRVYPNPCINHLVVQDVKAGLPYKLFSRGGAMIKKGYLPTTRRVETSGLTPGQHYLQVGSQSVSVVVQ